MKKNSEAAVRKVMEEEDWRKKGHRWRHNEIKEQKIQEKEEKVSEDVGNKSFGKELCLSWPQEIG